MRHKNLTDNSRLVNRNGGSRSRLTLLAGACLASLTFLATAPDYLPIQAQNRMSFSKASPNSGHIALGLALRKLSVSATFLQAPAHPDDETNALFTYFGYGMGLRVIDVQNNRGDGGQNEIGPELFGDIAVLRTSELLAAHRIDGAEQYFTRAIDYGYSFDPEEVIGKWGRKEIVGDYVRLWRTLRPDVIITMNIQGRGGDRAHEATTILVRESFRAAGDPSMYPEQLQEGLRPWQPKKLYFSAAAAAPGGAPGRGRGGRGTAAEQDAPASAETAKLTPVSTGTYDSLLGRTYAEIASDAHSYHKCQGVGGPVAVVAAVLPAQVVGVAPARPVERQAPEEQAEGRLLLMPVASARLPAVAADAAIRWSIRLSPVKCRSRNRPSSKASIPA